MNDEMLARDRRHGERRRGRAALLHTYTHAYIVTKNKCMRSTKQVCGGGAESPNIHPSIHTYKYGGHHAATTTAARTETTDGGLGEVFLRKRVFRRAIREKRERERGDIKRKPKATQMIMSSLI